MWRREHKKKSGNRIVVCTRKNIYEKLFSIVLASEVFVSNKNPWTLKTSGSATPCTEESRPGIAITSITSVLFHRFLILKKYAVMDKFTICEYPLLLYFSKKVRLSPLSWSRSESGKPNIPGSNLSMFVTLSYITLVCGGIW